MVLITITLCTVTISCVCMYLYGKLRYWHNRGFPCVSTRFNLHFMKNLLLRSKPQEVLLKETYDELADEKFGGYVGLFVPYLLLRDPEIINNVLVKDFAYFEDRFMQVEDKTDTFFDNVFSMRGEHWRYVRHKLTPLFSSNKVKLMVDQVVNCCNYAMSRVERDNQAPTDVENVMASYCFSVVGSTVFGLDFDSDEGDDAKKVFLEMIDSFFKPKFLTLLTYILKMGFPMVERFLRKFLRINIGTPETCTRILSDTIKMRERTGYRRNDFLQLMMDLKNEEEKSPSTKRENQGVPRRKLSEEEQVYSSKEIFGGEQDVSRENFPEKIFTDASIFGNSFLFLSIGTNSTSCVLSFMLYEISINTDIQDRLRNEIDSVLSGLNINFEHLKKLTYMDKVIAETMRLHIPTGTLVRNCKHDYKIPGTDKIVKKGETIVVMTSAMHHDEKYFENPEKFDPERFSDMRGISKGVYLPFGCGPRMCFAIPFVMMQIKITICKILSTYRLSLNSRTRQPLKISTSDLMTHSESGIWIDFERRI